MFNKFLKELNETLMVMVSIIGVLVLVFMLAGIFNEISKNSISANFEDQTIFELK